MADSGAPLAAVLMCHAPIVIPAIGGTRGAECHASTEAMGQAARIASDCGAETLVVLSPHLPRHPTAFGVVTSLSLQGDFGPFGRPELGCRFPADAAAGAAVTRAAQRTGLEIAPTTVQGLDHGALVPLWFLREAGFKGRVVVFGFPWHSSAEANHAFGRALREAMGSLERPWALVASGDMSHALKPGAPSGFHPRAQVFDQAVVDTVQRGDLAALDTIPGDLRQVAAEDVLDSLQCAAGVLEEEEEEEVTTRVLSYEGPFGVGYLIAVLKEPTP